MRRIKTRSICFNCGDSYWPNTATQRFCTPSCRSEHRAVTTPKPPRKVYEFQERLGQIGAASELAVAAFLLRDGWYVFRSLSQNSPIDLVAYKDGQFMKLEVKTEKGTFLQCQDGVSHLAIYKPMSGEVVIKELPRPGFEEDCEEA